MSYAAWDIMIALLLIGGPALILFCVAIYWIWKLRYWWRPPREK